MAAFSPLLDVLADVPDPRRAEGKLYKLGSGEQGNGKSM